MDFQAHWASANQLIGPSQLALAVRARAVLSSDEQILVVAQKCLSQTPSWGRQQYAGQTTYPVVRALHVCLAGPTMVAYMVVPYYSVVGCYSGSLACPAIGETT